MSAATSSTQRDVAPAGFSVFVDDSGRRRRRAKVIAYLVAGASLAYLGVFGASLAASSVTLDVPSGTSPAKGNVGAAPAKASTAPAPSSAASRARVQLPVIVPPAPVMPLPPADTVQPSPTPTAPAPPSSGPTTSAPEPSTPPTQSPGEPAPAAGAVAPESTPSVQGPLS